MCYQPDFVFIQATILKKLPHNEINLITQWQKTKGFKLIIISDNSDYDDIARSFGDAVLYQPYTTDDIAKLVG